MGLLKKSMSTIFNKPQWAIHQKRWFGKWHLYLGIFAGAILTIVGLTGGILVFQEEIDRALNPKLFTTLEHQKKIPLEDIIPLVKSKHPEKAFEYAMGSNKEDPTSTYRFYSFKNQTEFFVDPYTCEITGNRVSSSAFIRIVSNVHRTLLIPGIGSFLVGFSALSQIILTISGIRLWLPKKLKNLKRSLSIDLKGGFKKQNYDWHKVIGVFSAPVVLTLALTGFIICFSTFFIALLFLGNGRSAQSVSSIFNSKSIVKENQQPLQPREASSKIYALFPDIEIKGISLPTKTDGAYRFDAKLEGKSKTGKRLMFMVDQYSGEILLNSEQDFPDIGDSFLSWLTPLHYGTFGGLATRILALLGSLTLPVMFVSGFIIWWPKYKNRRKNGNRSKAKPGANAAVVENMCIGQLVRQHFVKGLKYALAILCGSLLSGAIYGLISGIIISPAIFMAYYTGMVVLMNFVVAVLAFAFYLCALLFRKNNRPLLKYSLYSLAFLIVFLPLIIGINMLEIKIF
jgi:uncharacterized iron-regulated membrane protein